MNVWKDFSLEQPRDGEYVLIFYKNKPITAYRLNGVWYDYLEYKINWVDNIKHWMYVEEPEHYNGYD